MTCDKCGVEIEVSDWPFCPHGRANSSIVRDEIPGGIVCENYGPEPIRFFSHSERRRYMKANGLVEKEKWCPLPGTDKDPQGIPNPAGYMDPQTLENARILLSRGAKCNALQSEAETSGVLVNVVSGELTEEEAIDYASRTRF